MAGDSLGAVAGRKTLRYMAIIEGLNHSLETGDHRERC